MSIAWLCQIDAFTRVGNVATAIRLASHDDDRLCHLDDRVWWPGIARLPTLSYDFFDGSFGGEIVTPSGRADVSIEAVPGFAALMLHGARIRWWTGELGAGFGAFTLRFDGLIDNQPAVRDGMAGVEFRVDDRWLDDPILATYAGTTGAEGEAAQKGQVKPLLLGVPKMVEGVLINSIDTIIQLNDGPIAAVDVAMEDAARFPASVGDYASYAALQAATVAPGFYATALAVGMVRHGAPLAGVASYDVQGSNSGADGGGHVRKAGAIIKRLAARLGKSAKVDGAGLTALDVARPWNISVALLQQTTMRELVQSIAQSLNAVALVTWTGLLTVLPIVRPEDATPVGTLASDGSALPPVGRVDQLGIAPPWWRLAIEAEVTNRVHGNDEIRFTATLIDRGRYDDAESYREGHIVDMADGSRWLYQAVTPTVGNDPPTWPVTSDAFWTLLTPPANRGKLFIQPTAPTAEESTGGDTWQDANARYWQRREDNHLSIGGNRLMIGGNLLTITWTPNPSQPVRDGIDGALATALAATDAARALALDAQATADGKVQSFYAASAPTAEGVGDLWFDTDDGNKQYRWSGSAWVAVQDTKIGAALDAAAAADAKADGKVTTFISESTPTAEGDGDLWFKASTGELRRWNGSTWGDPLVDLTSAAQVVVVPPATFTIYRTAAGAVKPDQLPVDLRPAVTRGGVDYRTNNAVSYSVTGTGGLSGKVSVNNTTGNAAKGDVTLANTITGAGTFQLTVTVSGIVVGTYVTQVVTADDPPPVDNGTSGGTDSSLAAISGTSYAVMTGLDGGDPVMDVAIAGGQTLKLNTNFYYRNASTSSLTMTCKGQYSTDGATWTDMNSGGYTEKQGGLAQKLTSPVEYVEGDMVAAFTKTGLSAATYKVRLLGKLTSGSGVLTPTSGGATSSKA